MEILDAQVDWKEGVANSPVLEVLVDEIPSLDEQIFESNESRTLWYSDTNGYVNFFSGHPERPGKGYSGRVYHLNTPDGEVTLKGPYSSRAGVMNKKGFGPCVSVHLATDPAVLERGYTFRSAAINLEKAQEAADIAGVELKRFERFSDNEPYWIPTETTSE